MASARLSVMEEDALSFADLLVELRLDRGLSQEALAACAGVSVRAISDLERGATRRPQRETLRALASGLSLGPAERDRFERAANQAPRSAAGRRPAGSSRLPAPVTPLVGRDADLAGVIRLLRTPAIRLVTVCGPGGVGKTRLAAEVGWRMGRSFDQLDGVDLGPLGRADDVPAAVAHGLGCHTAGLPPAEAVAARLGDSRWLLVLDSFERVVPAARWLADLLARCPRLAVLVTSRTPLQLRGEHLWTLAPLPLLSADIADVARLAANPAVALLVERVRAVRPGFALGAHNAVAVAELCRRLDGLPLAIELAAAHLRTQEPAAMLAQWDRRFADLPAVTVDGPERHRTLRCTVEWGTERLAAQDRVLFAVLGAFPGGVTPAAARAVLSADRLAGAGPDPVAFDASVALLAASSLVAVVDRAGGARITMLDTIREVAVDLLAAAGLSDLVNGAHAEVFLDLVRTAAALPGGFDRLDTELDNVRAGLVWSIANEPALLDVALVRALTGYFVSRSSFAEAARTLMAVADAVADDVVRAWALNGAGLATNEDGDRETAIVRAERSIALFERLGDGLGRCTALTVAGNAHKALGRYEEAYRAHEAGLRIAEELADPRRVTIALNNLGTLAHDLGRHATAREHYSASLRIKRELADERGIAVALMNLASLDNDLGRYADGRVALRQATDLLRIRGDQHLLAFALALLAESELGLGEYEAATAAATNALEIGRRVAYRPAIGLALGRLGDVALAEGDDDRAASLFQEALDFVSGTPDLARTLEHLAAARALTAPDEARRMLEQANAVRRAYRTPIPPADRPAVERTARAVGAQRDT